jgi:hypothetical protein
MTRSVLQNSVRAASLVVRFLKVAPDVREDTGTASSA